MKKLKLEELNRVDLEGYLKLEKLPITIVMDNVRSALNIGSVFRTSDAFAIDQIILTGISAKPPHKEINKTAIGATQSVSWKYEISTYNAVKSLKQDGYVIAAVEQMDQSTMLQDFKIGKLPIALVFGNEVEGISDDIVELIDVAIEVPQYGTKHSLNISVCAGIVIWDLVKKMKHDV